MAMPPIIPPSSPFHDFLYCPDCFHRGSPFLLIDIIMHFENGLPQGSTNPLFWPPAPQTPNHQTGQNFLGPQGAQYPNNYLMHNTPNTVFEVGVPSVPTGSQPSYNAPSIPIELHPMRSFSVPMTSPVAFSTVPMTSPAAFTCLPAPIQVPEQSLVPPIRLGSTSNTSQMENSSDLQIVNGSGENTEESDLDSLPNSPRKIILPVHIKYVLWMGKNTDENKHRFLRVAPVEPIEPYPVDVTSDPPDINLDFFQRDIFCHLNDRPKLWYLLDRLHKAHELIWVVTIANCRKYSKKASKKLNDDYDLIEFLQEAKRLRPNQATVEITMADPKANERDQKTAADVQHALEEEFGTDEERAVAHKQLNPHAETATTHQHMLAKLYRICLDHAEGSSEGLTFVNPENPQVYMTMGHERLSAWAQAIAGGIDGVDETHPPRTSLFQWIPIPQPNSQTSETNVNAPANSPVGNRSLTSNRPHSSNPTEAASHGDVNSTHTTSPYNHFNNDCTPLPITGVELRGSMEEFLATILIPISAQ